jgi:cellobiose phosphorylase
MTGEKRRNFTLPVEAELGLHRLTSASGVEIAIHPNGCLFAIEHVFAGERTLINQVFGSALGSGIGRILLRLGEGRVPTEIAGPNARLEVGGAADRFVWEGEAHGVQHRVTLWLHPEAPLWLWRVELRNRSASPVDADILFIQDLGLAARGLVLSNEAYASQYIDHTVSNHTSFGPVIMSRQNMPQSGRNPWVAHGCLDGAASFATDASQLFGPEFRLTGEQCSGFGGNLPGVRLQQEAACAALQTHALRLEPEGSADLTVFGLYDPDHAAVTSDADLDRLDAVASAIGAFQAVTVPVCAPPRSILQDARPLAGLPLAPAALEALYPERMHEEWRDGELLSLFVPGGPHNRHVVLAAKERQMRRRHGSILRSGASLLPDEATLSLTCWMHGVFGGQLTIGNTALHKLFSVSRDPYNITRASGLRILTDRGDGWRLLSVPSLFEMGLNDCRWMYQFEDGAISIDAIVSPEDTGADWHITVSGAPCRFLVFGHAVLGEREFEHSAVVELDETAKRMSFHPDPNGVWGRHYPRAVHHLVTSTPDAVEYIGGGEVLFDGKAPRSAEAYAVMRTGFTNRFSFAVVGALDDPECAERLAAKYEGGVRADEALTKASNYWRHVTRDTHFSRDDPATAALDTLFPWFAQNAMVHLAAPRGLEQYSAAAWGTRDVCQGPLEFLLPLGHHSAVREILRVVFAQQYERSGDWPQWFMLDPYRGIRDRHSHGDVIVWPLKALCDYVEATGDLAFLDEPLAWTRDDFEPTAHTNTVREHVGTLLATVRARFIPGTHLIRYGLGDWNDSLQPADPAMRDWMVSSWTAALLYQQIERYAGILTRAGEARNAEVVAALGRAVAEDFRRYLMPGGTVAGYALFKPEGGDPEWLLHPNDRRTGVRFSLIPMTRSMLAGLLTPDEARHHLELIREHLLFPDGARLMDKPVPYRGGSQVNFQRAESASFFGREIGLMYTHSHLRFCEALDLLGESDDARRLMRLVNPISITEEVGRASLRQRNAYFSSSDAAFRDRYEASEEWSRMRDGTVAVDGGWRVYSSGAGIFSRLALRLFKPL